MKDFIVDKVEWHIRLDPDLAYQDRVLRRFQAIVSFLKANQLIVAEHLQNEITEEFEIKASNLTAEGLQLIKLAYPKWQKAQDKGRIPENMTIMEKELAKLRGGK